MTELDERREPDAPAGPTRRSLIVGAGAFGAAGLLAACGDNGTPTVSGTTNPPPATTGGASADPTDPPDEGESGDGIKAADVPVGGGLIVAEEMLVVTQPTKGTFKAFDATCTHQQCQVSSVSGGKINCACHGSQYNIADGSVARGPAQRPLAAKTIKVSKGTITVT